MSTHRDIFGTALATEVRAARARAQLSQVEAARLLDVSARTYQEWESGRVIPQPRHRRRLAEFCTEAA